MNNFEKGFNYCLSNLSSVFGSVSANHYTSVIKSEINNMMYKLYDEASMRQNLGASQLQGFDGEVWHTYTQKIDAAIKGKSSNTYMPESNKVGSPDISTDKSNYSSKYYKDALQSIRHQAETIEERYLRLKANAEKRGETFMSEKEYMEKYFPNAKNSGESIYYMQGRLIPSDQLEEAKILLKNKIAKETANGRLSVAKNLQEVLDNLTDTVEDGNGNKSIKLTRAQAQMLAQASKNGDLDEIFKKLGITLSDLIKPEDILREAFKAGLSAAALSFILNFAPTVVNAISMLIKNGEIDMDLLKKEGFSAVKQTAKSFILGSISAGITIASQAGFLGTALESVDPTIISAIVVLTFNAIENGIKVAKGAMTKQEYAQTMMRAYFVTSFSVGLGTVVQTIFAELPIIPYLLGSFIGSVIGGFMYNATEKLFLSYCIESGCTFFGLVKQDYKIDESLFNEIGISTSKEEAIQLLPFEVESFEEEKFGYEQFEYERIGVSLIKRGIIGVFSIGYY